jgi:hypothetical protein
MVELLLAESQARRLEHGASATNKGRWSPEGFPILARSHLIDFGLDAAIETANADDYLATGWFAREAWGVWGRDAFQAIRFAPENYRGGYISVHVALQCFVPPGGAAPAIDFTANGYFLTTQNIGPDLRVIKLRIPPSCIGNGNVLLQLQHPCPLSPVSVGASVDPRSLGVGLASLAIT